MQFHSFAINIYLMNKFLWSLGLMLVLTACGNEKAEEKTQAASGNPEELAKLKAENDRLRDEIALKDEAINETVGLINEIETNLTTIASSEGRIRKLQVESGEDKKQFIMGEIEQINEIRKANQRRIADLNKKLEASGLQNTELKTLIENLTAQIAAKDMEIEMLKSELDKLDHEYVELFEAYVEVADLANTRENELNKAWYCYGTKKELMKNQVISKDGGFVGIGKVEKLRQDFNADYFEQIDIKQTREIIVGGSKIKLISTHPGGTYELKTETNRTIIQIKDPEKFWGVSKYLVVLVE